MAPLGMFPCNGTENRGSRKLRAFAAARPRRNRRPVRAGSRMPKECTNLVRRFRRKNVLELASLLLDLRLAIHGQAVSKQALRQPVTPDDASRSFAAPRREFHNQCPIAH